MNKDKNFQYFIDLMFYHHINESLLICIKNENEEDMERCEKMRNNFIFLFEQYFLIEKV
jgi:hypothetical protein